MFISPVRSNVFELCLQDTFGSFLAPKCFIGTLMSWCSKLFSCVRWNGVLSKGFYVLCDVRRGGGVLSPLLFDSVIARG